MANAKISALGKASRNALEKLADGRFNVAAQADFNGNGVGDDHAAIQRTLDEAGNAYEQDNIPRVVSVPTGARMAISETLYQRGVDLVSDTVTRGQNGAGQFVQFRGGSELLSRIPKDTVKTVTGTMTVTEGQGLTGAGIDFTVFDPFDTVIITGGTENNYVVCNVHPTNLSIGTMDVIQEVKNSTWPKLLRNEGPVTLTVTNLPRMLSNAMGDTNRSWGYGPSIKGLCFVNDTTSQVNEGWDAHLGTYGWVEGYYTGVHEREPVSSTPGASQTALCDVDAGFYRIASACTYSGFWSRIQVHSFLCAMGFNASHMSGDDVRINTDRCGAAYYIVGTGTQCYIGFQTDSSIYVRPLLQFGPRAGQAVIRTESISQDQTVRMMELSNVISAQVSWNATGFSTMTEEAVRIFRCPNTTMRGHLGSGGGAVFLPEPVVVGGRTDGLEVSVWDDASESIIPVTIP